MKTFCSWASRTWRSYARFSFRSITVRLAFGFLFAASLAATATGVVDIQRTALLHNQADFYQMLLQNNTTLTAGSDFLKSIQNQMKITLDEAGLPHHTKDILQNEDALTVDEQGLGSLIQEYDTILLAYTANGLLIQHPEQMAELANSNPRLLAQEQYTYAAGALQNWYIYKGTQQRILNEVEAGDLMDAQTQARLQSALAFADALSSLYSLIQFNTRLATLVDGATDGNANMPPLEPLLGAFLVFFGVGLVGFLISHSLIHRLKSLHRVTQAVQQGQMDTRVVLQGKDEITDVSRSVNTMLDSLVAALQQATTAREQIDLAYAQQRQLNEMKNHFILHVSHELRTPLTEVYGFLQLLQDYRGQLDAVQQENFVKQALKGCEELIAMCTSILDTSDQATLIQPAQHVPIHLASLVKELLAYWGSQEKGEHPVSLKIPGTLEVLADLQYVRQILRNLLSNAFKYTPANQPIFLEATLPEQLPGGQNGQRQALICVRDTGPGIPREEQGMLFQQFVRLKRDLAGNVRGSGLGLYLCRQFVEAMGGRIWVESTGISGEGSSFYFTLPVASPPDDIRLYAQQVFMTPDETQEIMN